MNEPEAVFSALAEIYLFAGSPRIPIYSAQGSPMVAFTAKIIEPVGLHARPAAVAVTEASKFQSDITVHCNGKSADLKSIIQVMKLGVQFSAQIEITCDGPDEQTAADTLQTILREKRIIQ